MYKQVQLIYGKEDFLIDDNIHKVINEVLPEGSSRDFAIEVLEGESADINSIVNSIQSMGMFQNDKVVIVKGFSFLTTGKDKDDKKTVFQMQNLKDSLENVAQGVYVLFVVYGSVDARKKFTKFIKKISQISEYKPFASYEGEKVAKWITARVIGYGKRISNQNAFRIHSITGGENLRILDSEIQKLITFVGDREEITASDIDSMVSSSASNIFSMLDYLIQVKVGKAISLLKDILFLGEQPIRVLALLVSHFRSLFMMKYLDELSTPKGDIAKAVGKHPYVVQKTLGSLRKVKSSSLEKIIHLLADADFNMKTGKLKPQVALELLFADIAIVLK